MDRKRVNGPEQSVAPVLTNVPEQPPILNDDGKRIDQRTTDDVRPICKKQNRHPKTRLLIQV